MYVCTYIIIKCVVRKSNRKSDFNTFHIKFMKMSKPKLYTTEEVRKIIIKNYEEGKTVREIGNILGRPKSTVHDIIKRYKITKSVENKPKSRRPKLLTNTDERWIVQQIKKNPKLSAPKLATEISKRINKDCSAETVRTVLHKKGYNGRVARKKPYISEVNRIKRLDFSKKYKNMDMSFWNKVLFTDESKFNLFRSDGQSYVWRRPNEELKEKNLKATVKHGGGSVLLWGCMSASGVGELCIIDGIMDQTKYLSILKQHLVPSVEKLGIKDTFQYYQDNDPKHKAHAVRMWLLFNCPHVLETPPQSPDINVIEHLWAHLETELKKYTISNKNDLVKSLKDEWAKIDPSVCRNLVDSMPRRLEAVIKGKGLPTKY